MVVVASVERARPAVMTAAVARAAERVEGGFVAGGRVMAVTAAVGRDAEIVEAATGGMRAVEVVAHRVVGVAVGEVATVVVVEVVHTQYLQCNLQDHEYRHNNR